MSDAEKVKILADTLRAINKMIYANGAPIGSTTYFAIRTDAVVALKTTGEPVS